MRRVALTGGIATGKSTILRRLQHHGVPTIDADVLARDAVAPGTPGAAAIRARFGDALFTPDGALDRQALAAVVFQDPHARRALEQIVHPDVYARIDAWFSGLPPETPVAVADIPLLFETGREAGWDAVIVAACDPEEQVARIVRRDGLTGDEARQRIAAQWPIGEKVRRADHVIWTDRGPATHEQVDRLMPRLSG